MIHEWLRSRVCWSESAEGSGGDPPPPQPPPAAPRREAAPQPPSPQPQHSGGSQQQSLADLRAEAASWRVALRQSEQREADARSQADQARADLDRARTEAVAPLQQKLERANQRMIDLAVQSYMVAAGLVDPDLAGLVSKMPDAPTVKLSDDYEVVGAKELAEAFRKWKPDFFRKADDSGAGGNGAGKREIKQPPKTGEGGEPPPSGQQPTTNVREMTKDQYRDYKNGMLRDMRRVGASR